MSDAARIAEATLRRSYGKLVALLASRTRDLAGAEDALAEAFAAALASWPRDGCPDSPEAWLLATARRRAIDAARRRRTAEQATGELQQLADEASAADAGAIPDQRLGLLFACAHPAIDRAIRAPLMLQAVLGLDAATIGSAFLVAPATMGQRLVRAKHKIRQAGIPFRVPERGELAERLDAVLDAIYAAFAEGWTATGAADTPGRDLADEALFLGRLVVELLPDQAEALGLVALVLHASARRAARRDDGGEYVPLAAQDPARWDAAMIDEAEALLRRAAGLGAIGRFQLEAALQSAHVERRRTGKGNTAAVVLLYDALSAVTGSPVVALNRALAAAEAGGAAVGDALAAIDRLDDPRLRDYQPYWAARAELLARTGAAEEAGRAYERAIGLATDDAVRRFLRRRQAAVVAAERR
jgi:RNA polymerase sigma-70 factor (ECF subfamily)